MTIFRNDAKGSRGILLTNGTYVMVEAGQTKTVPGDKVRVVSAGLTQINPAEAEPRVAEGGDEAELPAPPSSLPEIDGSAAERESAGTGEPMQPIPAQADGSLSQLDHDGDGKPGGSLAHEPPALSGMTKAQLTDQAVKEGILLDHIKGTGANGNVLADDIRVAIEAKRAAKS